MNLFYERTKTCVVDELLAEVSLGYELKNAPYPKKEPD